MTDAERGMIWWNALDKRHRSLWMKRAGDTGVAADAWRAFKGAGVVVDHTPETVVQARVRDFAPTLGAAGQ
jgi:hypothetical protein